MFWFYTVYSLWFRRFSVFRVTELVEWILGACEEAKRRKTQSRSLGPFSPSCAPNAQQGRDTPCSCNWDCAYANEFSVCVVILRISAANGNVSIGGVDVCRRVWAAIYVGSVGTVVLLVTSAFTGTKFTHLEAGDLPFLRIVGVQTQKTTVSWAIVGWFFWPGFSVTF